MYHIVTHADGKQYRREWQAGRKPMPAELKKVRVTVTISPEYREAVRNWKQEHGQDFSSWVDEQIYKKIHTETA